MDLEWKKTFVTQAKRYQRDIIPVYISGRNTHLFRLGRALFVIADCGRRRIAFRIGARDRRLIGDVGLLIAVGLFGQAEIAGRQIIPFGAKLQIALRLRASAEL